MYSVPNRIPRTNVSAFWRRLLRSLESGEKQCCIPVGVLNGGKAAAEAALPLETGGILLGCRVGGSVSVARFLEVRDPRASRSSYRRDHARAEGILATELGRPDREPSLGYVGEWHSHPLPCAASRQDQREIARISEGTPSPIILIVLTPHATKDGWVAEAWIAEGGKSSPALIIGG